MADAKVDAAYMKVRDGEVARTMEIRSDLLVDLADDGTVIGIERIGDAVTFDDLLAVVTDLVARGYATPTEAKPLTFAERRASADPSVDHDSHSQGWVDRCGECPS